MDESTLFPLLIDLHRGGERQGPGGKEQTLLALELTGVDPKSTIDVADPARVDGMCGIRHARESSRRSNRSGSISRSTAAVHKQYSLYPCYQDADTIFRE